MAKALDVPLPSLAQQMTGLPQFRQHRYRYPFGAQALAYKLGQLKFRELRDRAMAQLAARFEIRSFHDETLHGGVLPLDLLDARTDSWIRPPNLAPSPAGVN